MTDNSVPISLKDCAWDKERKTLTLPIGAIKTENWAPIPSIFGGTSLYVKSHVTDVSFLFWWKGDADYRTDGTNKFWIFRPTEAQECPIRVLYVMESYFKGQVYVETKSGPVLDFLDRPATI